MGATKQILATKLYLPQPTATLVIRPRLLEQLQALLRTPLTVIVAPAGFGKTTLASTWAGSMGREQASVAWLTVDATDDDPAQFWAAVVAALQTVDPALGEEFAPSISSTWSSPQYLLTPLINQLAQRAAPIVLVLDDYHVIESSVTHSALSFFIEHLPPLVHLVLISRSDPPVPMALLRARGQLTELRATDLRFTAEEAALFLNGVMDLRLEADAIAALDTRTEGWIAGLHLAALSLRHHADRSGFVKSLSGSHHYIQDYLIEEVLQRQAMAMRAFLLHTAVLERLCASLCNAVVGGTGAAAILERMERANLFLIPLDDERRWYRYHHLFVETLRARLAQEQPEHVSELHRRASAWYAEHAAGETAMFGEAVRHALSAGDGERAAELIQEAAETLWAHNEQAKLLSWLADLPQPVLHARPRLAVLRAQLQMATGSLEGVPSLLEAAAAALADSALPPDEQAAIQGGIAAVQVHILQLAEQYEEAIALAKRALELLPPAERASRALAALGLAMADHMRGALSVADPVYRDAIVLCEAVGDRFFEITTRCLLGRLLQERGDLAAAETAFQLALQRAALGGTRLPIAGWAMIGMGTIAYARHDLRHAELLIVEGLDLVRRAGVRDAIYHGSVGLIRLRLAQSRYADAHAIATQFVSDARASQIAHFARWAEALLALVDLTVGNLPAAAQWARLARPRADALLYTDKAAFAVLVRVLIATGEYDAARRCIAAQRALVAPFNHIKTQIELYLLDAVALIAKGDRGAARVALDSALAMAAPRGFVQLFVDAGEQIAVLVAQRSHDGPLGLFARRLQAAFEGELPDTEPAALPRVFDAGLDVESQIRQPRPGTAARLSDSGAGQLVEPLSEREFEVLGLMAEGLSNQEIASRLVISVPTVKKHGSNIFGKLNAAGRTEAVAQARDLGLLPPLANSHSG